MAEDKDRGSTRAADSTFGQSTPGDAAREAKRKPLAKTGDSTARQDEQAAPPQPKR